MKKEIVDGALVVKDGDALAEGLKKLPYLEVKRKDWKKVETHQWKVMRKRDMTRWWNRVKRFWGSDNIATIDIQPDGENDWIRYGEGLSPLCAMNMLPSFDAIREYAGVLEEYVDKDFDYKAKQEEGLKKVGAMILSVLAFAPFLRHMLQMQPHTEESTPLNLEVLVETLPPFVGWGILGVGVSLLVWCNLEVLAGLSEGKWWIFTSYIKRREEKRN